MLNETNERKWSVYLHTVPKEITRYPHDKYYVGITKSKPSNRWGMNGNGYKNQTFGYAINKYGWDNIKHEILLECLTENEAKSYERMYVEYYQSFDPFYGYNRTKGGDDHSVSVKPVAQYSLDGKFIRIYGSTELAAKKNGWKRVGMFSNHSHGYQWRYVEKGTTIPKELSPVKFYEWTKEVEEYDLFGNYVRSYDGCDEAARQLGMVCLNLRRDRTIISGEHQYKYAEDEFIVDNVLERNNLTIPVYCYSLEGCFLQKYDNKKEALRALGIYDGMKAFTYEDYNIPFFVFYNVYNNAFKGFRWAYSFYNELPPLVEVHYKEHPVVQLDNDFNLLGVFANTKDVSYKYRRNKDTKAHTDNISSVCRENIERYKNGQRLRKAYGYIWFRFIDIKRSEIKISDLYLLRDYYICERIINDLERRNKKKCQQ